MKKIISIVVLALMAVSCQKDNKVVGELVDVKVRFYGSNPPYTITWYETEPHTMILKGNEYVISYKMDKTYYVGKAHSMETETSTKGDSLTIEMWAEGKYFKKVSVNNSGGKSFRAAVIFAQLK